MLDRYVLAIALALPIVGSPALVADPPWLAHGTHGMVASDSPPASRIGAALLKRGGNAVDAAVAVSFALAVTRPYSTGPGGGAFTIVRQADGAIFVQDAREQAPAAARADMYVVAAASDPNGPPPSRYGVLAVGVPGWVAGRMELHAKFGTRPLVELMAPAIALAEDGFAVDDHYVTATEETLEVYERYPALRESCAYVFRTHLRGGNLRRKGEVLQQPALARLLREIASTGGEAFVHGAIAKAMDRTMREGGGILRAKDLTEYHPKQRAPIRARFYEYELIAMGSPSSGGIALAEALNILEAVDFRGIAQRDTHLAVHYELEAMKHAFADRSRYGGDADFVDVPTALLTSKPYAAKLAARISETKTRRLEGYGIASLPEDAGTSHFSIVDGRGMVVASTETINTAFGSLAAVDEWGLILNNEMDDFAAVPGKPNAFGLIQSDRNAVAPGKRPLSSMSPTIVLKDNQPFLILGASGGPRIISSVLHMLLEVTMFGHTLEQGMRARRPHHQWQPDRVFFDEAPSDGLARRLEQIGHRLSSKRKTGIVQAIVRTSAGWTGASDPRKGGRPAGY